MIHRYMATWYNYNKWHEANQVTVYKRGRCFDVGTWGKKIQLVVPYSV